SGRSLRRPSLGTVWFGDAVVGGVHLDQRELGGVEAQPVARGLDRHGVEKPGVDERLVDPAGDAANHGQFAVTGPMIAANLEPLHPLLVHVPHGGGAAHGPGPLWSYVLALHPAADMRRPRAR